MGINLYKLWKHTKGDVKVNIGENTRRAIYMRARYIGYGVLRGSAMAVTAGITHNYLKDNDVPDRLCMIGGITAALGVGKVVDHVINDQLDQELRTYDILKEMKADQSKFANIREHMASEKMDEQAKDQISLDLNLIFQDLDSKLDALQEALDAMDEDVLEDDITITKVWGDVYKLCMSSPEFAEIIAKWRGLDKDISGMSEREFVREMKKPWTKGEEAAGDLESDLPDDLIPKSEDEGLPEDLT